MHMKKSPQMMSEWKSNAQGMFKNVDPARAHEEFSRIVSRNGGMSPELVVEAARNPKSPLHNVEEFYWDDDSAAAQKHREAIAAKMVRMLITYEVDKPKAQVRAFVSMRKEDEPRQRVYFNIEQVMVDPTGREQLIRQAWLDILRLRNKYTALTEFARIFEVIDEENQRRRA
jgi:hypothetical protein